MSRSSYDDAIIEAAEKLASTDWCTAPAHGRYKAIVDAVAAKREAMRPKLLTAAEAHTLTYSTPLIVNGDAYARQQAVLDAAHARAFRVIEAEVGKLNSYVHPRDSDDTATVNKLAVIEAVRTALKVQP